MRKTLLGLCGVFVALALAAQENLEYFLPDDQSYKQEIPAPDEYFGQLPGEWHLTHGQVLNYFRDLAMISERAILQEYARSHENKPLVQLIFTSEENHEKLEELRKLHLQYSEPGSDLSPGDVPLVIRLGYSVHGNESSATNSSVLTAYYLAAAEGGGMDSLLRTCIILVDPCLNPDGYSRHTTWANTYQSSVANGDGNSSQFGEPWPRGRGNHYWFDLNRDYLPLVNPESKGRVKEFHDWLPNIVTDHHESSPNFSFFFQPGIPSRNNPLIPDRNYTLTSAIAAYHARFLDKIGSAYFSEEVFDDYYFGKGSTYPDVNGSIGILFEQSSIRGRVRETENGPKSLAFGIRNQFTVSLSTLRAGLDLRNELLEYQKGFYQNARDDALESEVKAYVFGSDTDRFKTAEFISLLNQHEIQVYATGEASRFLVPLQQKQYRMIRTIFEEVSSFRDTSFYDISSWTLTHAFDIPVTKLNSLKGIEISDQPVKPMPVAGTVKGGRASSGYLFRWDEYSAPGVLYALQSAGLRTKVATGEFSMKVGDLLEHFSAGTVQIPLANQTLEEDRIHELLTDLAEKTGVDFYALNTGLSPSGIDMGSNSFSALEKPDILMFTGGSTSSGTAGEVWHLLDQRYRIPVTLVATDDLGRLDLDRYSTVILPGGSFREWGEEEVAKLKRWVTNGGILIAMDQAAKWAADQELGASKFKDPVPTDSTRFLSYADRRKESSIQGIGGAILKAELDLSHPLCYGYARKELAIFKRGTRVAVPLDGKYLEPVRFAPEPYLSGWISEENLERLQGAPVLSIQQLGQGKLISFHETVNFRGFWMGTHKLFMNAIFFGETVRLN